MSQENFKIIFSNDPNQTIITLNKEKASLYSPYFYDVLNNINSLEFQNYIHKQKPLPLNVEIDIQSIPYLKLILESELGNGTKTSCSKTARDIISGIKLSYYIGSSYLLDFFIFCYKATDIPRMLTITKFLKDYPIYNDLKSILAITFKNVIISNENNSNFMNGFNISNLLNTIDQSNIPKDEHTLDSIRTLQDSFVKILLQ